VATTATVDGTGATAGATKRADCALSEVTVPHALPVQPVPATPQWTLSLMPIESVVTVALKSVLLEGGTTAFDGETVTIAAGALWTASVPVPSQPTAQATTAAPMSRRVFAFMCGTPVDN
jgi:hypothetical protein